MTRHVIVLMLCLCGVQPALSTNGLESAHALVRQLGDGEFKVRKDAEAKLRVLGPAAIEALEQAVKSDDPEIAVSAAAILRDARMGIGPDWPPEMAEKARRFGQLDTGARINLICDVVAERGNRAVPFLLHCAAIGNYDELRAILQFATTNMVELADGLLAQDIQTTTLCGAWKKYWAYRTKGRRADALRVLTEAQSVIKLDPSQASLMEVAVSDITLEIENSLLKMHRDKCFKEIAVAAAAFAEASPSNSRFLYFQAEALDALGRAEEADLLRNKAYEVKADDQASHLSTAFRLSAMGREDWSALEWERVIVLLPEDIHDVNAYFNLPPILRTIVQDDETVENLGKNPGAAAAGGTNDVAGTNRVERHTTAGGGTTFVAGKAGEQVRVHVRAVVKDRKASELKAAVSNATCRMTMKQGLLRGRLLEMEKCSIVYNKKREEVFVLLTKNACRKPRKIQGANALEKAVLAVYSHDCVYLFEIAPQTESVRRIARFEKDYRVRVSIDPALRNRRARQVTVCGRSFSWDEMVKGITLDYLPPVLRLFLHGEKDGAEPDVIEFAVPLDEPVLEPLDE